MATDYTDTDKVNRLLGPHKMTDVTKVTIEDGELLIKSVQAEVDMILATINVSTIPVSLVSPFKTYLGTIVSWGVAAQVLKATFPEATGPGESPAFQFWETKFQEALALFSNKPVKGSERWDEYVRLQNMLLALGITTYTAQPSNYFSAHPDREADLGILEGASLFRVDDLNERPW